MNTAALGNNILNFSVVNGQGTMQLDHGNIIHCNVLQWCVIHSVSINHDICYTLWTTSPVSSIQYWIKSHRNIILVC